MLEGSPEQEGLPEKLRRIRFVDEEKGKSLVFLTNNFNMAAITVCGIYKGRWRIELFLKWIKQNLRVKAFYGTSENALKSQIWIAICVYLAVACLNKIHKFDESLSRILQVLSVNAFQREPINQLLMKIHTSELDINIHNQLMLNIF